MLSLIFVSLLLLFSYYFLENNLILKYSLIALSLLFLLVIVQFFRKPLRKGSVNEKFVFSPADGKVVAIEEVVETEFFKDKRIQVSIFMSPLNVHVNWAPVAGKVKYAKYHSGLYLVAWHPKSSSENERTTFVIETKNKSMVMFRQIAGAMARRIIYYIKEGEEVAQCSEMGFIKFGSRVDVLLPMNSKINVTLDQKVRGCETVIASLG